MDSRSKTEFLWEYNTAQVIQIRAVWLVGPTGLLFHQEINLFLPQPRVWCDNCPWNIYTDSNPTNSEFLKYLIHQLNHGLKLLRKIHSPLISDRCLRDVRPRVGHLLLTDCLLLLLPLDSNHKALSLRFFSQERRRKLDDTTRVDGCLYIQREDRVRVLLLYS